MPDVASFLASLPAPLTRRGDHSVSCAVIRKQIKVELGLAVAAGVLPQGIALSIRGDYNHVTVQVTAWPTFPLAQDYVTAFMDQEVGKAGALQAWMDALPRYRPYGVSSTNRPELAVELNAALALIEKLVERHNYDDSDSMTDHFDVGYYTTIDADPVRCRAEHGLREEANPALAAKRQAAREASARLGKAATRSICGRTGVEGCGEWSLDRLLKLDAAAKGRPVTYSKRDGRWLICDLAVAA